jgi:hypothetical protein
LWLRLRFWRRIRLWFGFLFRYLPCRLLWCWLGLRWWLRLGWSLRLRLRLRRRWRWGLSLGLRLRLSLLPWLLLPGLVVSSAVPRVFWLRRGRRRRRWRLVRRRAMLRRRGIP